MAKRNQLKPTRNQLENGKTINEDKAVTNVTNYFPIIDQREGNSELVGSVGHIGNQSVTVVTSVTERTNLTQLWDGHGLVQVGHPPRRFVALNESGTQRIGQDHARAKLSNAQVEAIRDEHEAYPLGDPRHVGYRRLAEKWRVSKRTIRDICTYSKRNQWAGRWKRID